MKILLTGANGLIGQAVAAELARDHQVIALGRADWTGMDFPAADALVHCAGVTDEEVKADPRAALHRAGPETARLLAAAQRAGARHLAYVSSAHVYGPLAGAIDEATPTAPASDYARAHLAVEQAFAAANADGGLILRPCAVFGPLQHPGRFRRWSLIPFSFPREGVTTGRITLKSAGFQKRNFISSAAVARLIAAGLGAPGVNIRNAVGSDSLTVLAFAQLCAARITVLTGRPCRVEAPPPGPDDFQLAPLDYATRHPGEARLGELSKFLDDFIPSLQWVQAS